MANINIYGTLFNNLFKDNEKVIVLGSQVYGNGAEAPDPTSDEESAGIFTDLELKQIGTTWTTNIVMGSQYDINRIFKLKINNIENNIYNNYVPYTGAGKNVDLWSHTITSAGFGLTNLKAVPSVTDGGKGLYLLTNRSSTYNCVELYSLFHNTRINWSFIDDETLRDLTLYEVIDYINYKVNHITNPLRFKGVINPGDSLPTKLVEVGDVWHFNTNVGSYYVGDEVVCTSISPNITWELLGQNITPIPTGSITFENLESN